MKNKIKKFVIFLIFFLSVFCFINQVRASEIIVWPQKYYAGEETFYIEGKAGRDTEVLIFLKNSKEEIKKWLVFSDGEGDWFLSTKELIKPGTYYLVSQTKDSKEISGDASEPKKVEVFINGLVLGSFLISFKDLAAVLAFVFLAGIIIMIYAFYKAKRGKKILKKEAQEARESLSSNFNEIRAEIKKRIEMLDSQPGFNEKERIIYDQMEGFLNKSEKTIKKEIEDIEKEIR